MDKNEVERLWEGNAEAWTQLSRMGYDICRDFYNAPAFQELLPDISGFVGLDIGCGEGTNTRMTAKRCKKLHAIDISPSFIKYARESEKVEPLGIDYQVGDAQNLPFSDSTFDFAISTMCMMSLFDPALALKEVYRILKKGGFFQFSITHPCYDTPIRFWVDGEDGKRVALAVGGYFEGKEQVYDWIFHSAPQELREKYPKFQEWAKHHTLSQWLNMISDIGFTIERLNEPFITDNAIKACPSLYDLKIVPIFLHIRCKK